MKLNLILILIIILIINKSSYSLSTCNLPYVGINCTSLLTYIPLVSENSTRPIISFNSTSSFSMNNQLLESIQIDSISELDSNNKILKTTQLSSENKWFLTFKNSTIYRYEYNKVGDILIKADFIITTNLVPQNKSLNYTSIELRINLSNYQFITNTNKLQLNVINSISNLKISNGVTVCADTQVLNNQDDGVLQNKVLMGDTTLLGELNAQMTIDDVAQSSKGLLSTVESNSTITIKTTTSIVSSQILGIRIPSFVNSTEFSTIFFPIKESKSLVSTNSATTKCVTTKSVKNGLTDQQVAAVCVGVIGFFIIGCIALYFFVLDGRYINKLE